jgi:dTDP-4-amino-4,6-dideoxy-D-galactose acyltransferase
MTALSSPTALTFPPRAVHSPDRVFAGIELRKLDWDSSFFGRKMGALVPAPEWLGRRGEASLAGDLRHAIAESADDGYEHLMLRVPSTALRMARAAEAAGFRLVDVAVDLAVRVVPGHAKIDLGLGVRPVTAADIGALQDIAQIAFPLSRFTADPFFTATDADALYREWVANLCGGLAKCVLVAHAQDEAVGFTSCAVQPDGSGRIPLIATSDLHRRQGIGRALVESSIAWFAGHGIQRAWVKTQASNYPALALYSRSGFVVAASELTFTTTLSRQQPPL